MALREKKAGTQNSGTHGMGLANKDVLPFSCLSLPASMAKPKWLRRVADLLP